MATRVALAFLMALCGQVIWAQAPNLNSSASTGPSESGRVVRDPTTGKIYYQQWITESVPTTRWENKPMVTTIYETQWINALQTSTQTVLKPQAKLVPQAYWKGAWSPFQQPTLAYSYSPVTSWEPQTATVKQVVPRQQVVTRQQTIMVTQPVTEIKTQRRLVQTEISPQQAGLATGITPLRAANIVSQPPARISPPFLAGLPSVPLVRHQAKIQTSEVYTNSTPVNQMASVQSGWIPSTQSSQFATAPMTGLRPVGTSTQSVQQSVDYRAPMMTATASGGSWTVMQGGMQPTVLR